MTTATVHLGQAVEHGWDAIVVGAGPAGALAARELARQGTRVLLVDRATFPRWKVCGCCLNRQALATLQGVGLGGLAGRWGAVPLKAVRLAARARRVLLPLPGGAALSRERLDSALVEAAVQAGAAFLPGTWAALGSVTGEGRQVILRQGGQQVEATARVVLAANGLGGGLLTGLRARAPKGSRIGAGAVAATAPPFYTPGIIFMACGTGGYAGLVRLEDGRLDVAAALDPELVRQAGGPGRAVESILAEANLPPVPGLAGLAWRGTPALTRQLPRPAAERLFVLGDAAGYIEPFTGEGIAWALASAVSLAPLAACACRGWSAALADEWARLHRRQLGRRQRLCRAVTAALRHPSLVRLAVGVLAWMPALAQPLIRRLNLIPPGTAQQ
ncbi:MAG TPA: FAD-dependent monooxygenase [Gemmataceae bacterium]|nr:FAD-dependent monooxygenase [Gemmataceae bacterium]